MKGAAAHFEVCSCCAGDEVPWQLRGEHVGISWVSFLLQGQSCLEGLTGPGFWQEGRGQLCLCTVPVTSGHLSLVTRAGCGVHTAPGDSRGLLELLVQALPGKHSPQEHPQQ